MMKIRGWTLLAVAPLLVMGLSLGCSDQSGDGETPDAPDTSGAAGQLDGVDQEGSKAKAAAEEELENAGVQLGE